MNDYVTLILGVVCAGIGGELFVRGAVGLAHWARISPGIIGATVAAFATSSPELSVSINAALAGKPQIALGDALGSNVINVALILAIGVSNFWNPKSSGQRKKGFSCGVVDSYNHGCSVFGWRAFQIRRFFDVEHVSRLVCGGGYRSTKTTKCCGGNSWGASRVVGCSFVRCWSRLSCRCRQSYCGRSKRHRHFLWNR